jgi:hypothetical protein
MEFFKKLINYLTACVSHTVNKIFKWQGGVICHMRVEII